MIRIRIDISSSRKGLYREALDRLYDVEITEDSASTDALITDDRMSAQLGGMPCLLDCPESLSLEQTRESSASAARIMPAHAWRFSPNLLPVQQCNEAGKLGQPGLLRVHHWLAEDLPAPRAAFAQVDLAHWLFGASAELAHSLRMTAYLQLHLGFPNDGMAIIDIATARPGSDSYYSLHIIGSDGAAYADDHHDAHLLIGADGSRAVLPRQRQLIGTQRMLEEFVAGIKEERPWSVSVQESIDALEVLKEVADG